MASYTQVLDPSTNADWNNAYIKAYGKYIKISKEGWEQTGDGGGGERVYTMGKEPEKKPPAPAPISSGYSPPPPPPPAEPEEPEATPEPTVEEKRAEITKPATGLESTIVAPVQPTTNVSYLTGNTQSQTTSRFLKKKTDAKKSLFA